MECAEAMFNIESVKKQLGEFNVAMTEAKKRVSVSPDTVPDLTKCNALLSDLKRSIAEFSARYMSLVPPFTADLAERLVACRSVWEATAVVAVMGRDVVEFERSIKRLRTTFYKDYSTYLPKSSEESEISGLYLLYLLTTNRLGEFHTVIEQMPLHARSHECVRYTLDLEVCLMDGNYNKVVEATAPRAVFACFMKQLVDTARMKVAQCLEASYVSVSASHACKLLMLTPTGGKDSGIEELRKFANQMNQINVASQSIGDIGIDDALPRDDDTTHCCQWVVRGEQLVFDRFLRPGDEVSSSSSMSGVEGSSSSMGVGGRGPSMDNNMTAIPALELIQNVIEYATEMERIV